MKITIDTISHNNQRYNTVGDWLYDEKGISVLVSETNNNDYNFLVALHELIEAYLCKKRGIKEEVVTEFDIEYEKRCRPEDKNGPGDAWNAPYGNEHKFAGLIEMMMAYELRVDWEKYEESLDKLEYKK